MNLDDITVLVLTYNEEANIRRTLSALNAFKQVVVLDSGSTDSTLDICSDFSNTAIFHRQFDTHGAQWEFGRTQTNIKTEWILALDADFFITERFIAELRALDATADGYETTFRYAIHGKPLRASLYPPKITLLRRGRASFHADGHTHRETIQGTTGTLKEPIWHDDRKPIGQWLRGQQAYAKLEADKIMSLDSADLSLSNRLRKRMIAPLLIIPYCLFAKRLILDGSAGIFYTAQRTLFECLLLLVMIEKSISKKHPIN